MIDEPVTTNEAYALAMALRTVVHGLLLAHVRAAPDAMAEAADFHRDHVTEKHDLVARRYLEERTLADARALRMFDEILAGMSFQVRRAAERRDE